MGLCSWPWRSVGLVCVRASMMLALVLNAQLDYEGSIVMDSCHMVPACAGPIAAWPWESETYDFRRWLSKAKTVFPSLRNPSYPFC